MRKARVLVVDDEEGMLEVCQETLERLEVVRNGWKPAGFPG